MKIVKADLPSELETLEIHTFADEHIGDKFCDMKDIQRRIDYVKNTPNAYCVLNGDLLNNATRGSVSDIFSDTLTPMQQVDRGMELFAPIKDKVLAVTSGNHELRTYKNEGIDLSYIMAREMRIEDKFGSEGVLLYVRFGLLNHRRSAGRKIQYKVYMTHGSGGGRRVGAKANRLEDMANKVDADLYIHSHTHTPLVFPDRFFRTYEASFGGEWVGRYFVNVGAALDYGGYGERAEYRPASKQKPVIFLDGHKKGIKVQI